MKNIIAEINNLEPIYCDSEDCTCHTRLDELIDLVVSGFQKIQTFMEEGK